MGFLAVLFGILIGIIIGIFFGFYLLMKADDEHFEHFVNELRKHR